MSMEPGAKYVLHLGRRHKVVGWHKAKKVWVLEHPLDPQRFVHAPNEHVTHIKGKKDVDPNQGELFKRDSQYARRKHLAAGLAYTGAGIGASALATRGGASAVRHLKALRKWKKYGNHLEGASTTLTTVGAGAGAIGGVNFARIQNEEAKHKVSKGGERLAAQYTASLMHAAHKTRKGGKRVKLRKLSAEVLEKLAVDPSPLAQAATTLVSKDYNERLGRIKRQAAASDTTKYHEQKRTKAEPNKYSVTPKKQFDSERARKKRSYVYEGAAYGGAAGATFGALRPAPLDLKEGRNRVKAHVAGYKANMDESQRLFEAMNDPNKTKSKGANAGHAYRKLKAAGHNLGQAGAGYKANAPAEKVLLRSRGKWGAAALGLAATGGVINHNRNNQGRTYTSWHDGSAGPKKKLRPRS